MVIPQIYEQNVSIPILTPTVVKEANETAMTKNSIGHKRQEVLSRSTFRIEYN